MPVMTERPSWSDERLDDLSSRVDDLGRRIDAGFAELRPEMNARFKEQDARWETRFDKQDAQLARLQDRMDSFQLTLIILCGGLIAALIATLTGVGIALIA
jgi:hypothetical protein